MQELEDRVAVVTGGGGAIGRGIALALAREGMQVAVADLRAEGAEAVAREIEKAGGRAVPIAVDVTSADSLARAAAEVSERLGDAHLLCANAGVLARIATLDDHGLEDWEYTFSVNVLGVVKTVKAFLPQLLTRAPEAHIVNTGSLGGLVAPERIPIGAYVASKYACVGFSEMLRGELAEQGIGVSVLCPGVVPSDLVNTSTANRPSGFGAGAAPDLGGGAAGGAPPELDLLSPEEVGPRVVEAVRANRLHVITHPRSRAMVERRFRAILADYDFAEGRS